MRFVITFIASKYSEKKVGDHALEDIGPSKRQRQTCPAKSNAEGSLLSRFLHKEVAALVESGVLFSPEHDRLSNNNGKIVTEKKRQTRARAE